MLTDGSWLSKLILLSDFILFKKLKIFFETHVNNFINNRFTIFFSVDRNKYQIHIPLPPKIDPTVTMMQVEEKPDVTYSDVGGCKEQIEKLREVVETPLLHVSIYSSCV